MDWKTILFSFAGRINRARYWAGVGLNVAVWVVAGIIILFVEPSADPTIGVTIGGIVFIVTAVGSLWVTFAVMTKRLHDREKSAWWILLFWALPIALAAMAQPLGGAGRFLSLMASLITIWAFADLGCVKGTEGPNAYGPDPLSAEPT